VNAEELFQCPSCRVLHKTQSQALDCCYATIKPIYQCRKCRVLYSSLTDASKCCEN